MPAGVAVALTARIRRIRLAVRRATAVPVGIRVAVWLCGCAAFTVAYPLEVLLGPGALVLIVLAAVPAVWPGGRLPTGVILVVVFGWLTSTTSYAQAVTPVRLLVLAALLYLVHTLAALAAQLPYDAVVTPGVPARWLARAALVMLLTGLIAVAVLVLPALLGGRVHLAAAVGGLVIMALLATLLARTARASGAARAGD